MPTFKEIKERDNKYYLNTYMPYDIAFMSGNGCTLVDTNGKEYIDFLAGIAVNSLGYNNPIVVNAMYEQAKKLTVVSNYYYSEPRGLLAEKITEGIGLKKVFFVNCGAEASETSFKLARKYFNVRGERKYKFVTAISSFHGRTLAAVSATGQPKYNLPYAPLPEGFGTYIPFNDIDALEKALSDKEVCAFFIEPIQGEGGVRAATPEYMKAAREITKKNNQLLIFDEVQTGAGRTGKFWAFEHYGIEPDILNAAKGMGGGFPIGATLTREDVGDAFVYGDHGTTFGGAPLACAVSYAIVSEIKKPEFLQNVTDTGAYFKARLQEIKHPAIKEVRGMGLMLGMDLDENLMSARQIVMNMHEKGFVLNVCGKNLLRFVPPLIIKRAEIDKMIEALKPEFKA